MCCFFLYDFDDTSQLLDVNECALLNGQCTQTCTNIPGSFVCSCDQGYFLSSDRLTCNGEFSTLTNWSFIMYLPLTDVNECQQGNNGGCAQVCSNSAGSFSCQCREGFSLQADEITCIGREPCRETCPSEL